MSLRSLSSWTALLLVFAISSPAGFAQEEAMTGIASAETALEAEEGTSMALKGTVLVAFRNQALLLEDDTGMIVIQLTPDQQPLGIQEGDQIHVIGSVLADGLLRNEVRAEEVEIVEKSERPGPKPKIISITEILTLSKQGEIVFFLGRVTGSGIEDIKVSDASASIQVNLGRRYREMEFSTGTTLVVAGVVKVTASGKMIDAIKVKEMDIFEVKQEVGSARTIEELHKAKPLGKVVRATGRLGVAFHDGEETYLLYDGEAIMGVYLSEQFKAIPPLVEVGEEAHAIGTFALETTKRGREVPVLRNAKIVPVPRLPQDSVRTRRGY